MAKTQQKQSDALTDEKVTEILVDFIETSETAIACLTRNEFTGDRKRAVAQVLKDGIISPPYGFPCSRACQDYGRAIAGYILAEAGMPVEDCECLDRHVGDAIKKIKQLAKSEDANYAATVFSHAQTALFRSARGRPFQSPLQIKPVPLRKDYHRG